MLIGRASLILAALLPSAVAQDTGSVEGRVTSGTNHAAIAGVAITVGTGRVSTDPSGGFRIEGLSLGAHTASLEAPGFLKRDKVTFRLDSPITPGRLDVELIPESSISGRVLDDENNPVPGVRIEITQAVRGTGTMWSVWGTVSDRDGRYRVDGMSPGAYLVMAEPHPRVLGSVGGRPPRERPVPPPMMREGERRVWVPTWYPSVTERSQAARLVLRGGTQQTGCDIRMLAVTVHTIRGLLYDDAGKPANGTVSLVPSGPMELPEAEVKAHDGIFEFPDVPSGDWRLAAEMERAGVKLRGAGAVLLSSHDVEDITLRLASPFVLRGFVEPRGKSESATVELYPLDVPPGGAAYSKADSDGTLRFPAVYSGHYQVNVFATIPGHYLDSVLIGGQDVLGKDVLLAEGMPPIDVVFKPDSAGLRGKVEDCGGASILILPRDEGLWNFRFIRRTSCDSSGHFEVGGLRPGDYYALALDRVDPTGLDDLSILRRLAGMGEKAQVDSGRIAYIELKVLTWPD